MQRLNVKMCKCGEGRQRFGFPDQKATCCGKCKENGMRNLHVKLCRCGSSQPTFGHIDTGTVCCKRCMESDMIQLRSPMCYCGKQRPSLAIPGATRPTHCALCKTSDMICVYGYFCPCGKHASCGLPGARRPTHCVPCKSPEMVCTHGNMCQCGKHACFGIPGGKATCCATCQTDGMQDVVSKRCVEVDCEVIINSSQKYCANHDTEKKRVTRRKEFILGHHLKDVISVLFTAWNKMPKNARECGGAYRPDFVYVLDHYIIIVECDEFGHEQYDISCDRKRMVDLFNAYGGRPILFIRWNPDPFKVDGRTRVTKMQTRLDVCAQTLERELKRTVEEVASMPMFRIIKLFFDNDDSSSSTPYKQESHLTNHALETGVWIESK